MCKRNVFIISILCFSMIFSACGNDRPTNDTAGVSLASDQSAAPKIAFHDTIDDPQVEYLNTLGGTKAAGTASLDLILYETEPNVFEGYGAMTRSLELPDEAITIKQEYCYRTGLIRAEEGKEGSLTLTGGFTEDRDADTYMGADAPFRFITHKDGSVLQKNLPFQLKLEGEKASLFIKMHEHANFIFYGNLMTDSEKVASQGDFSKTDHLICVNSLWPGSLTGGGGDYTAILLVEPDANKNGYSGQLSINGNGNALKDINEKVTFSLMPFDNASYRKSGGKLVDRFPEMGITHTSGGDYLLLLDGKQAVLEAAGKEMFFYGKLHSDSELTVLKNEADQTRTLLSYLCRQKSGTSAADYSELKDLDPNNSEDMKKIMEISEELSDTLSSENGKPAWYPDGLIPAVNFSEYDGYLTNPAPEEQFFKIYETQYYENEDFADLVPPYRAKLSGYDGYKEYMDYDRGEGIFLFTMGKYSVQVCLMQSSLKLTGVSVQIY